MPGVYLSYPFCTQKCTYCNFASGVFPKQQEAAYLPALRQELARTAWPWQPETLYWGGGTPSLAPLHELEQTMAAIPGRPWREATMEAAPGSFTLDTLRAWRQMGFTRVSLGVQSFLTEELRKTGRKHTAQTVCEDLANLSDAGFTHTNVDLIAGLAGQTRDSWLENLDWIRRLRPDHVSVYMLEVDEDSRLGLEILDGGTRYGAGQIPSEEAIAWMYEEAARQLAAMGIPRYEISNFAQPGGESLHNLKYWQRAEYLGFGVDAHSFAAGRRWQNVDSAAQYLARLEANESPLAEYLPVDAESERLFLGLRLSDGVALHPPDWQRWRLPLERFLSAGLLETTPTGVRLTPRGILLSNEVFQEFLPA